VISFPDDRDREDLCKIRLLLWIVIASCHRRFYLLRICSEHHPQWDHHGHWALCHQVYHVQNWGMTLRKQNRCNCSLTIDCGTSDSCSSLGIYIRGCGCIPVESVTEKVSSSFPCSEHSTIASYLFITSTKKCDEPVCWLFCIHVGLSIYWPVLMTHSLSVRNRLKFTIGHCWSHQVYINLFFSISVTWIQRNCRCRLLSLKE
jgi:hypothetical protein